MADWLANGTGRRKTSVARVYVKNGSGDISINGKKPDEYFTMAGLGDIVRKPLEVTDSLGNYDIQIHVKGGGLAGQADACKHGLSRALCTVDETNQPILRKNGFLSRDARMVERKKYGQRGARRKFQFSKR